MKLKRCHNCNFFRNKNRCYFSNAETREKGLKYQIIGVGKLCKMRNEIIEELIEIIPEPEPNQKTEKEIRIENLKKLKEELRKRHGDLQ